MRTNERLTTYRANVGGYTTSPSIHSRVTWLTGAKGQSSDPRVKGVRVKGVRVKGVRVSDSDLRSRVVIPSERSESRDLHFTVRDPCAAVSRGARGGRGETTRGGLPSGSRSMHRSTALLHPRPQNSLTVRWRDLSAGSAPPRARTPGRLRRRTAPRLRAKLLARPGPESRTASERQSVPRPSLIPSFPHSRHASCVSAIRYSFCCASHVMRYALG